MVHKRHSGKRAEIQEIAGHVVMHCHVCYLLSCNCPIMSVAQSCCLWIQYFLLSASFNSMWSHSGVCVLKTNESFSTSQLPHSPTCWCCLFVIVSCRELFNHICRLFTWLCSMSMGKRPWPLYTQLAEMCEKKSKNVINSGVEILSKQTERGAALV